MRSNRPKDWIYYERNATGARFVAICRPSWIWLTAEVRLNFTMYTYVTRYDINLDFALFIISLNLFEYRENASDAQTWKQFLIGQLILWVNTHSLIFRPNTPRTKNFDNPIVSRCSLWSITVESKIIGNCIGNYTPVYPVFPI